jgi:hypothetical protein
MAELLLLHALFVIGLDLADEAGLAGQQCAYAHAVLGRDDELDFIQACAALVGQLGRAPAVVLRALSTSSLPRVSLATTKGPEPMMRVASPSSSKGRSSVAGETRPEPITEVPWRKPGEGF